MTIKKKLTKREAEAAKKKKAKMLLKTSKKEQFLKLWPKKMFNISKTCRAIKISRDVVYLWAREDEDFKRAMQEKYEAMNDTAEETLFKKIKAGDTVCTLFYLKCQAKDRGYVETQRVEHVGNVGHYVASFGQLEQQQEPQPAIEVEGEVINDDEDEK